MSDLLEPKAKRETAKEPPKKWRNWWCSAVSFYCSTCGTYWDAGVDFPDCCRGPFPSLDLAETDAERIIADIHDGMDREGYLGAYPEGERP